VDINAQMAALELSYDRDWIRFKASLFYASGDGAAQDGEGNGSTLSSTILISPAGRSVGTCGRDLTSRYSGEFETAQQPRAEPAHQQTEGQANFVNPGLLLFGVGTEIEVAPKLRSFINVNYINFLETDPIKTALLTDKVDRELGLDLSIGSNIARCSRTTSSSPPDLGR